MKTEFEIDHECTEDIVCPYCGSIETDSWEIVEDYGEQECDECGESFSFNRQVTTTYTTAKV